MCTFNLVQLEFSLRGGGIGEEGRGVIYRSKGFDTD